MAVCCSSLGYLLLMLRWHGNTNWWESLYIAPGYVIVAFHLYFSSKTDRQYLTVISSGFGTGIAQSAVFISIQVVVDPAHMAPAVSFLYLTSTVWTTIGLPLSNTVMQTALKWSLNDRLSSLGLAPWEAQKVRLITITSKKGLRKG